MSHLKYRPEPEPEEASADAPLKFPGNAASSANSAHAPARHPAELALERAQRRLDNLREVLGPAFGREYDGPRAA